MKEIWSGVLVLLAAVCVNLDFLHREVTNALLSWRPERAKLKYLLA
jgi:hypothetical protein